MGAAWRRTAYLWLALAGFALQAFILLALRVNGLRCLPV
jgi:hypothetical protein